MCLLVGHRASIADLSCFNEMKDASHKLHVRQGKRLLLSR